MEEERMGVEGGRMEWKEGGWSEDGVEGGSMEEVGVRGRQEENKECGYLTS